MDALYQKQILSLAHSARASTLDFTPAYTASCNNPVCGDRVTVSIAIKAEHISDINVAVKGCALCEAGAGLLLESARHEHLDRINALGTSLRAFLDTGNEDEKQPGDETSTQIQVFAPVKPISNRHKCVTLAFDAFDEAIGLFRADRDLVKSP
ncbi:iron-sulfur cluster assembly scaffold protein [Candidatus Puniceispirillum marinum]|uniref:NifU-like protein involved in Fe-S cluster formation n=1 Tax=Puniceispirillum marinum (strain IMCC1322) TaxID=488538 RepID=D5BQZ9_PUNMI|nr:iron-sulfur cluster assembly scaffold protein [Candidatus Puniceispirillum marinum]ADE38713.1 NifU-like protein involved in Fe-S cluster formation [Candidatus Puniceispirillum marinum IMCC1322]